MVDMGGIIRLVAQMVFPEPALPDAFFASFYMTGAQIPLWQAR